MIKKICDFLSGIPMTIVGAVFLVISFILPKLGVNLIIDTAWVTILICGIPLLYLAIWRIINNKGISKISSALLIVIAMFASIGIGDLFAAGEVAFIMAIGSILEEKTTDRAKKGLKKLINLTPVNGRRIINNKEEIILASEIKKGYVIRVLPGETIPVDGKIIKGETSIDQSIITGESLPVDKEIGDTVFCGTINRFGSVDIKATKVGEDSSLQKLIKMVQDAENKKAPIQRIADKTASWLVPVALFIAIIVFVVTKDIVRAVTILVVFCPCSLVLATPTAVMAAIGQATKYGVIIKSGEVLETMGKVNTITFDKTGTLTYGKLSVSDVISVDNDINKKELIVLAGSCEQRSEHPLGKAIVEYANDKKISLLESDDFKMMTGKGVSAKVNNMRIFCGNKKYLEENKITISDKIIKKLEELQMQGKASIIVANEIKCIGIIGLSDIIRTESKSVMEKLNEMNIKTVLLTGDNQKTANYLASQIKIKEVYADLLPEEKVLNIEQLKENGNIVCMIGDGVNDAPALKIADVGVAMGSMGSDIAVESADIALMSDDISKIPYLKRLSCATVKTIKLSITLSMTINFIAIILSILGILNPTTGALVHNAGSCFVVLIAALLYDRKF